MALHIGILALQGAFREHAAAIRKLGAQPKEVRQLKDVSGLDGLIIPGGESTTIGKLLNELGILEPLKTQIKYGMPVYGTCAGLILLCNDIEDSNQPRIGLLNAKVRRNAFGRQYESFEAALNIPAIGGEPFLGVFIRAPLILEVGPDVEILAEVQQEGKNRAVAVRQGNMLATSFHPELTPDQRFHQCFLDMCK